MEHDTLHKEHTTHEERKEEISAKLANLPPEVQFPNHLQGKIRYDAIAGLLIFKGVMSREERKELLGLSNDKAYGRAVKTLFQDSQERHGFIRIFTTDIRKRLIAGAIVLLPVYVTFYVLKLLFTFAGGTMVPVVQRIFLRSDWIQLKIPDTVLTPLMFLVGLAMLFLILYFAGAFATNFIGRRIISFGEGIVERMPLVKTIYGTSKQLIHSATLPGKGAFKRVVLVDFPRKGSKALGFVTGSFVDKAGNRLVSVFVSTSPNPTSGFVVLFPESEVEDTHLSVEEGFKIIVSGGILTPSFKEEIEKIRPA